MCAMWYLLQPPRKIKYHIQYDKHNIEYITFINNMELRHRIKSILEYSDKNISEFQRFVGFKTPQAVSSLLNGKTKTLSKTAEMLLKYAFPEINENWLINGEGEMLKETTMDIDNVSGEGNTVGTIVNQTIKENSGQNAGRDIQTLRAPTATSISWRNWKRNANSPNDNLICTPALSAKKMNCSELHRRKSQP